MQKMSVLPLLSNRERFLSKANLNPAILCAGTKKKYFYSLQLLKKLAFLFCKMADYWRRHYRSILPCQHRFCWNYVRTICWFNVNFYSKWKHWDLLRVATPQSTFDSNRYSDWAVLLWPLSYPVYIPERFISSLILELVVQCFFVITTYHVSDHSNSFYHCYTRNCVWAVVQ